MNDVTLAVQTISYDSTIRERPKMHDDADGDD